MVYNVWDTLGIPPTSDKKEIKRAYAKQSAACHPEEHPEEFDQLYNAYKTALKIAAFNQTAKANAQNTQKNEEEQERGVEVPHTVKAETDTPKAESNTAQTETYSANTEANNAKTETHTPKTERHSASTETYTSKTERHSANTDNERAKGKFSCGRGAEDKQAQEEPPSGERVPLYENTDTGADNDHSPPNNEQEPREKEPQYRHPEGKREQKVHPVIPPIAQLVEKSAEKEAGAAAAKLLNKLQALHNTFPKSVNTKKEELEKALHLLDRLFESPWFDAAGWEPEFLVLLDQWLQTNRRSINRAEAVALFNAYQFQQFGTPAYPANQYLAKIHWEIMQQARRYERDMIVLAGMKPLVPPKSSKSPRKGKERRRPHPLLMITAFIVLCIARALISTPTSKPAPKDAQIQRLISEAREANKQARTPVVPDEFSDIKIPVTADTAKQGAKKYGPVERLDNLPISPEEYEYNGKNQLTIAYSTNNLDKENIAEQSSIPLSIVMNCISHWNLPVTNSLFDGNENENGVIEYDMETYDDENISFQIWLEPVKAEQGHSSYRLGGCSYWAEAFLHFASQEGIEGRTWYDEEFNAHLILKWDSVKNAQELAKRLFDAGSRYYSYMDRFSPPLDLAIIYGSDTDSILDSLQALKKSAGNNRIQVTIPEDQLLKNCGESPLPELAKDRPSAVLSSFDPNIRWISWAYISEAPDSTASAEEMIDDILDGVNGLDWVLSRFEIKNSE